MVDKPFAPACERNREPILACLRAQFLQPGKLLEIGSGTGQHAVYIAPRLPHLRWQTSDRTLNHAGIKQWLRDEAPELALPLALDVDEQAAWPAANGFDYVFAANVAHIMAWSSVEHLFAGVAKVLRAGGRFALYGPFRLAGEHTAPSNAAFDASLRASNPVQGIRDLEAIDRLAQDEGLVAQAPIEMPANNFMLLFDMRGTR